MKKLSCLPYSLCTLALILEAFGFGSSLKTIGLGFFQSRETVR